MKDLLQCIENRGRPRADIAEGSASTSMCVLESVAATEAESGVGRGRRASHRRRAGESVAGSPLPNPLVIRHRTRFERPARGALQVSRVEIVSRPSTGSNVPSTSAGREMAARTVAACRKPMGGCHGAHGPGSRQRSHQDAQIAGIGAGGTAVVYPRLPAVVQPSWHAADRPHLPAVAAAGP